MRGVFFKSSYPAWGAVVSLKALLDEKIPSIVRIAKLDRDVSGTGRTIDEELSKREKVHADLRRNFALCYLACHFVQFHIPGCGRYPAS